MNEATQAALTATYLEFYASCPEGFESALDAELRAMGLRKTRRLKGRVTFTGTVADAYRACLWSRLLTRQGEAIFSCNLRTFKPDIEGLARAGVVLTDITTQTIPEDFARNPRIHKCDLVKRYTVEEAMQRAGIEADPR